MNKHDTDTSRLFTALSNTADGAFVIDKEQRIVFWNQAAQKILGTAHCLLESGGAENTGLHPG